MIVTPFRHISLMSHEMDIAVQTLAARQGLFFSRTQAQRLGATNRMIERRLDTGRWVRPATALYALPGHRLDSCGRRWAATLSLVGSIVSHEAAAELNHTPSVPRGRVVITVPRGGTNRSPFATVHESLWLPSSHLIAIDGLPVTDRIRTLLDLSAVLRPGRLAEVITHELACRTVDPDALTAAYEVWRCRGRRRCTWIARLLDAHLGEPPVASELERAFRKLVRVGGIDQPDGQVRFGWLPPAPGTVDFAYPNERLIIEVDGRSWHTRDADFERDRRRDVEATLHGWRVLRFTCRQVRHEPEYVLDAIRRARRLPPTIRP
jgi:hypothetical protein